MGTLAEETPKSLLEVQGRPILWYIMARLCASGVRRFVLPVGYLGYRVSCYADAAFANYGCEIHCIDTGADTPIGARLAQIRHLLPTGADFFLTNGDALFDFDVARMFDAQQASGAAVTFATAATVSKYGLVVIDHDRVTGFERQAPMAGFRLEGDGGVRNGYVYAGMAVLNEAALDGIDLAGAANFEAELYPRLVESGRAAHFPTNGFWYAIDTPKDLDAANEGSGADPFFYQPTHDLKAWLEHEMATRQGG